MGWTDAFSYFKASTKQAAGYLSRPYKARVGSLVTLPTGAFLRAALTNSLVREPSTTNLLPIVAISRLNLDFPGKIYRYYLAKADGGTEKECFIQIVTDPDGAIQEAVYCVSVDRIIPTTREEQALYKGLDGEGLGSECFPLAPELLQERGYTANQIAAAQGSEEMGVVYTRDIGTGDYIKPLTGTETRMDSEDAESGLQSDIWFMPYARTLTDGGVEYLYISTESVESQDGKAVARIQVDFMLGLPLQLDQLVIQ